MCIINTQTTCSIHVQHFRLRICLSFSSESDGSFLFKFLHSTYTNILQLTVPNQWMYECIRKLGCPLISSIVHFLAFWRAPQFHCTNQALIIVSINEHKPCMGEYRHFCKIQFISPHSEFLSLKIYKEYNTNCQHCVQMMCRDGSIRCARS